MGPNIEAVQWSRLEHLTASILGPGMTFYGLKLQFVQPVLLYVRYGVSSSFILILIVSYACNTVLGCTFFIIFIFDALRNLNDHKHF